MSILSRLNLRPHTFSAACRVHKNRTYSTQQHAFTDLDNAPIVQLVRRKLQERSKLQSETSEDRVSAEDVARIKKIKELEQLQHAWEEWTQVAKSLQETTPLLSDSDPAMRALAEEEHASLTQELSAMVETTFPRLLIPASSTAHMSALVELRSGVGGSESSLFLGEIMRMYLRVAGSYGWKASVLSRNETENGGIKDAILEVKGEGAYDILRWESGVHRVQRVPATEANGRVHTSTVSVMVLPTSEDSEPGKDEELFKMSDVRIEVMRARGAGGQHVNKTESAVRLVHDPTGITVSMQDERSQHQNKRRAFQVLRARLMDRKLEEEMAQRRAVRKNLVRSADRSEKVRTYNYAQDRVTDHRLGWSVMNLLSVMEGDALRDILQALEEKHGEEQLEELLTE
ncbi:release factor [Obba rivulosa]|uniref:Release factor n=1 Tax=Obba rivulosa TaxID=1052685 RepID=A0A8E2AIU7_9APHY|nr:release factor [Obba rivulosa]